MFKAGIWYLQKSKLPCGDVARPWGHYMERKAIKGITEVAESIAPKPQTSERDILELSSSAEQSEEHSHNSKPS